MNTTAYSAHIWGGWRNTSQLHNHTALETWEGRQSLALAAYFLSLQTKTSNFTVYKPWLLHKLWGKSILIIRPAVLGALTPLWCWRYGGNPWQAMLSHSHASQDDWQISPLPLIPLTHPIIPHALPRLGSRKVRGDESDIAQKGLLCKSDQGSYRTSPSLNHSTMEEQNLTRAGKEALNVD